MKLLILITAFFITQVNSVLGQDTAKTSEKKFSNISFHYSRPFWDKTMFEESSNFSTLNGNYLRSWNFGLTFKRDFNNKLEHQVQLNFGNFPTYFGISINRKDFPPYFNPNATPYLVGSPTELLRDNYFFSLGYAIGYKLKLFNNFKLIPSLGISGSRFFIEYSGFEAGIPASAGFENSARVLMLQGEPSYPLLLNYQVPLRLDLDWKFKNYNLGIGYFYNYGIGEFIKTDNAVIFMPNTQYQTTVSSKRNNNFYGFRFYLGLNF